MIVDEDSTCEEFEGLGGSIYLWGVDVLHADALHGNAHILVHGVAADIYNGMHGLYCTSYSPHMEYHVFISAIVTSFGYER